MIIAPLAAKLNATDGRMRFDEGASGAKLRVYRDGIADYLSVLDAERTL